MSEPKFRYEIHPRIPMRNVLDKAIIKPTTVELTIEQVKECLKYGPVYRRFNADHIEKVTLATLDKLHTAKFGAVVPEKKEEPKVEEVKEEAPVVDEKVEEPAPVEEKVEETPVAEEKVEEVVVETPVVEEPKVDEVKEEAPVVEEKVEEKVEEVKEETVPEAPVEDTTEEEKSVESSEDENVTEVTEDDSDDVEAPQSSSIGRKRKHH